jgi:hypothetical protein
MAAKALLKIDVQIAFLRRECEEGRANNVTIAQLKKLLEQRQELIPQMLAERQIAFAC